MSDYASGSVVVEAARIALDALDRNLAVLVVEGRDDERVFGERCVRRDQIIVAGNKPLLLEAYAASDETDRERIIFVSDCDHDVPLGRVTLAKALVVSRNADLEADFVELGGLARVIWDLLPVSRRSEQSVQTVINRAVALAEALGRFRRVNAGEGLSVRFEDLQYQRLRAARADTVDMTHIATTLVSRSPDADITRDDLAAKATALDVGFEVCNGHDLLAATVRVLHDDMGVRMNEMSAFPRLVRLALTPAAFDDWLVVRRIRGWEAEHGRHVFAR